MLIILFVSVGSIQLIGFNRQEVAEALLEDFICRVKEHYDIDVSVQRPLILVNKVSAADFGNPIDLKATLKNIWIRNNTLSKIVQDSYNNDRTNLFTAWESDRFSSAIYCRVSGCTASIFHTGKINLSGIPSGGLTHIQIFNLIRPLITKRQ
jgi:hypothetical protein